MAQVPRQEDCDYANNIHIWAPGVSILFSRRVLLLALSRDPFFKILPLRRYLAWNCPSTMCAKPPRLRQGRPAWGKPLASSVPPAWTWPCPACASRRSRSLLVRRNEGEARQRKTTGYVRCFPNRASISKHKNPKMYRSRLTFLIS